MQTRLADYIRDTAEGREAASILRTCVHCGFCNATCPTYQLLGDELDGPRGRIYLMKQMLEGSTPTMRTLTHLDRCLTCRNCETTCPSGVRYGRLLDIGREVIEQQVERPLGQRLSRALLRRFLHSPLFGLSLALGRLVRPVLPASLRRRVPVSRPAGARPDRHHARRMLLLEGCVQPALSPDINAAAARVLDRLGIELVSVAGAGCCGAIDHHLGANDAARAQMRRNIDAWWPQVDAGAEAIVMTASGCGVLVKDYGVLLADDPAYADRAARISALTRDLSEVLADADLSAFAPRARRIAFHPPCTLQHGQKLRGVVERILTRLGFELLPVTDSHLCCGSAGTYSILQPELSSRLRDEKLGNLQAAGPELIATANIGCQTHLAQGAGVPVVHWITLLDPHTAKPT
jgi:glycolate oxidase iron-sulfur subunit